MMEQSKLKAEADRFKAKVQGEIPQITYDWGLSDVFNGKSKSGEWLISRIRMDLPFAIPESMGKKLMEKIGNVFQEMAKESQIEYRKARRRKRRF